MRALLLLTERVIYIGSIKQNEKPQEKKELPKSLIYVIEKLNREEIGNIKNVFK